MVHPDGMRSSLERSAIRNSTPVPVARPQLYSRIFRSVSGPPSTPPNWFILKVGFALPARLVNQLFAPNTELRMNSNAVPWSSLLPDFVLTLMAPPGVPAVLRRQIGGFYLELLRIVHRRQVVIWSKKPAELGTPSMRISYD